MSGAAAAAGEARIDPVAFAAMVGTPIATSDWFLIDQDRIDRFADVTEDRQAIHIDHDAGVRAGFGGTIAHGFLSLSLLSAMAGCLPKLAGQAMIMNYGFDKIRFLGPVKVGSRVKAEFTLSDVTWRDPRRMVMTVQVTIVTDQSPSPVMTANWLAMSFFHEDQGEQA
jgi:acyl dehydratase